MWRDTSSIRHLGEVGKEGRVPWRIVTVQLSTFRGTCGKCMAGITKEGLRSAVQVLGLRKGLSKTDRHKAKMCPIYGCGRVVKKMGQHMRLMHGTAKVEPPPPKTLDSKCKAFRSWLCLPNGGAKDQKSAQQHARQTQLVASMAPLTKDGINGSFLETHCITHKYLPGTIRSYLTSIKHFISYLLTSETKSKEHLTELCEFVTRWIASFRKQNQKRILEKMDSDLSKLITPENVTQFKLSRCAQEAVAVLAKPHNITQADSLSRTF